MEPSDDWTLPAPAGNKLKCSVKVVGYDDKGKKLGEDPSDVPFGMEVVKLTSLNGGEALTSADQSTITWTTHETKDTVANVLCEPV